MEYNIKQSSTAIRPMQEINDSAEKINDIADDIYHRPPNETSSRLKKQVIQLDRVSDELRKIMTNLFPSAIELGLITMVRENVREFRDKYDLDIELQLNVSESTYFPTDILTLIYHVMTESLNNVVKHADTTDVCIMLCQQGTRLLLTVTDEGKGCHNLPTDANDAAEFLRRHHFGIVLMMEAAQELNGTLSVKNNKPKGTIVSLDVPLNETYG